MSRAPAELPTLPPSSSPSLLFLILDIHPLSWSLLADPPNLPEERAHHMTHVAPARLPIEDFLNVLMVFLNAHLASTWGNEVVVYAATAGRSCVFGGAALNDRLMCSKLLYPPPASRDVEERPIPNTYYPFRLLDRRFEDELKRMVEEEQARFDDSPSGFNGVPCSRPHLGLAEGQNNRLSSRR